MPTASNTSPIYNLASIERLPLLQEQFDQIWIPDAVRQELGRIPEAAIRESVDSAVRSGWIQVRPVTNRALVTLLATDLDIGEAEAIALALEIGARGVLIDERDARVSARELGLEVTGVLGVLLRAKRAGRIALIRPELAALRVKAHFFIAPALEAAALASAGE